MRSSSNEHFTTALPRLAMSFSEYILNADGQDHIIAIAYLAAHRDHLLLIVVDARCNISRKKKSLKNYPAHL